MTLYDDDEQIEISDTSAGTQSSDKGDGKTKLTIKRKDEAPLKETDFEVLLELTGTADLKDRTGLDLVAVLDISDSMKFEEGKKLKRMKTAMQFVIKKLTPNDRLSVVTFAKTAARKCALEKMDVAAQAKIGELVENLTASGLTNIVDGLLVGKQILDGRKLTMGRASAVLFMCDGEDTVYKENVRDVLQQQIPVINFPVYTFGFGRKQDAVLLKEIADKSPGGTYSDVQNEENLTKAFSQCLAGLLTIVAPDLTLTITPEKNSKIISVTDVGFKKSTNADGSLTIFFGDLFSKEIRKVIVSLSLSEIKLRPRRKTASSDILQVNYTYTYSKGIIFRADAQLVNITRSATPKVTQENEDILIEKDRLATLKAIKAAIAEADRDNLAGAVSILDAAQNSLHDAVYDRNEMIEIMKYELKKILAFMITADSYKKRGRPFALSCVIAHDRQRYATKGDIDLEIMRLFATPRMNQGLVQATNFDKDSSISPPTADEDTKEELKNNPYGPVAERLGNHNQNAKNSLLQNDNKFENVETLEDIENIARNVRNAIQSLEKMLDSIKDLLAALKSSQKT
ncbi:E3 ubiquitin-protein ligase WAV3-like [Mercurialis annua]|uniref:E3 ubiquitin-protein ligase WAV3-like n=1 Tax=Mercurialis annua TaxID=3986 RepID=UPI00215EA1B1|nr:E3 ubiquitin-protein ligase WAV3-like [Mercurialis annua]